MCGVRVGSTVSVCLICISSIRSDQYVAHFCVHICDQISKRPGGGFKNFHQETWELETWQTLWHDIHVSFFFDFGTEVRRKQAIRI